MYLCNQVDCEKTFLAPAETPCIAHVSFGVKTAHNELAIHPAIACFISPEITVLKQRLLFINIKYVLSAPTDSSKQKFMPDVSATFYLLKDKISVTVSAHHTATGFPG